MEILVAGASGFVGARLCAALVEEGHVVRAMTRQPAAYRGAGKPVRGDVSDPASLREALAGCDAAYYLVHSLDSADFARRDADGARAFAEAVSAAGLEQVVYLGGLGDDSGADGPLSEHLLSRHEVERLLASTGVPVTVLRAGIIVGAGGISWELTRQLVEHLPVMVTPRWVRTRTQPIGIDDVVRYLVGVLTVPEARGRTLEIGGTEVLEYRTMLERVAAVEGRSLRVLPVPLLTPRLSSRWLSLVTDVDVQTGRSLVDSMSNEVVVRDDAIRRLVPFEPLSYDAMVRAALAEAPPPQSRVRFARTRVRQLLLEQVPRDHRQPDAEFQRRRKVVAATGVLGTAVLQRSLTRQPGSREFYGWSAAAATAWLAGGVASGPLHLGHEPARDATLRRPVATPAVTGAAAFAAFYGCALVVRQVPVLERAISSVLDFADEGSMPLVLATALANGAAEEVFFRGALYAAVGEQHQVAVSTAAYTVVTLATRNPALVLAAGVMGSLFGLQRRATGGIQAPLITHLTWSSLMLRFLPPLFRKQQSLG